MLVKVYSLFFAVIFLFAGVAPLDLKRLSEDNRKVAVPSLTYSREGNYLYNDQRAVQRFFGFNELYDRFSPLLLFSYDTVRVKFSYEGKDWMIQLWKGTYAVLIGCEVGIYTKPESRRLEHYSAAREDDWLSVQVEFFQGDERLFSTLESRSWWHTGYLPGYLPGYRESPRAGCALRGAIEFPSEEMAALFAGGLMEIGFTQTEQLGGEWDQYVLKQSKVEFTWRTLLSP
ncbi:MAG: DUF4474 domain-containing protein [Oscillospiraceae bacterium]|nr:DUF4474 domain-containing protein [Oscillospiraceae bacterium]